MRNRRRRGEQGQVLVLAIAFIAFFGLVTVSALGFIDTALLQHNVTEQTAGNDALAEGAADYALNTVTSHSLSISGGTGPNCDGPTSGSATWTPKTGVSDTMSYSVNTCIPNYVNSNPGINCVLCILGTSSSAVQFTNGNSSLNVRGEVDVAGGVSIQGNYGKSGWNGSTLCSSSAATATTCAGTPEFIGIEGNPDANKGSWPPPTGLPSGATLPYSPAPTTVTAVTNPLASLPLPSFTSAPYNVSVAASLKSKGSTTLTPGAYQGLNIGGNQTVVLQTGLYVFTGTVSIAGGGVLTANPTGGVTLFFGCSTTVAKVVTPRACSSAGEAGGGNLSIGGSGVYAIAAPTPGSTGCTPTCTYHDVAVFQDPNNTSQVSIGGSGTGNVLAGGLYAKSANVDIGGNGTGDFQTDGRLVAQSLTIHTNASAGLDLSGNPPTAGCDLYSAVVTGTENSTTRTGVVTFVDDPQGSCGGSRIVGFIYTP